MKHANFLRSTQGIISTGHTASDFDSSPADTTYDSGAVWSGVSCGIQCIDSTLYMPKSVYRVGCFLWKVENLQLSDRVCSIPGGINKTATDGRYYYYNTISDVRKIDLDTGEISVIYTGAADYVSGLAIMDYTLYIDIGYPDIYTDEYRKNNMVIMQLPRRYTVTFLTASAALSLAPGDVYGELPDLQKDGYRFAGWFTHDNVRITPSTVFDGNSDITLYPHWKKIIGLKPDVPAVIDEENDLLIITALCDITALFSSGNICLNGSGSTGTVVTVDDEEELIVVLRGDADGDGKADARDAVYLECLSRSMLPSTPVYLTACDLNGDGAADEQDKQELIAKGMLI